jgi:hypothetical protein
MLKLRPYSHLFRQGLIGCLVFMTPVFVVLYAITVGNGRWGVVLALQLVATVLIVLAAWGYFAAAIWVSADGITERGFFGRKRTYSRDQIGSIVQAETYSGAQPVPQLFVCDHDGAQLVRMRGQFWSQESMDVVRSTLDVRSETVGEAVTTAELRQDYPGLLYWFERHPLIAGFAFGGAMLLLVGLAMVTLSLLGIR